MKQKTATRCAKPDAAAPDEAQFSFEEPTESDTVREKFEILGIKMDVHKSGVLYLKELVRLVMHYQ